MGSMGGADVGDARGRSAVGMSAPPSRCSPLGLAVAVMRLLGEQGVIVSLTSENLGRISAAANNLLRALGAPVVGDGPAVVPYHADPRATTSDIPSTIWQREDMRSALAARDLATAYRIIQRFGISQRRIAAATGQSQSEISEILGGRRVGQYDVLVRVAEGLRMARGWLGLAYDEETAQLVSQSE